VLISRLKRAGRSEHMAFTAIRTAAAEGVMTITLARPDRLNAFTSAMHAELREALSTAENDASVRCVVLTGEGRAFSAGQDLTEDRLPGPDGKADFGARLERDYNPLVERIYAFPKVTIAALNGGAVGASANIALACDILVAARSAYLQEAFAKIALAPDAGGTWWLPRIVGAKRALALMLTARPDSGERTTGDGARLQSIRRCRVQG
jgi:2-(1,2-epoxy-1,2-dihydrophenyl)acetyl-CoA isomerase